jgi:hypothetical protein
MSFFSRKKKSEIRNIMELTPNRIYSYETADNGMVSVLIPRFHNKILAKIFNSRLRDPFVRVKFDEFGSSAWLEIDGKKNVYAIAQNLLKIHGEKIQPVFERVSKFLNQLYIYKFIYFNEMKGEV